MQEVFTETAVLQEHDYIGLSQSSSFLPLRMSSPSADSSQLGLEETDLHLELGLGLGLGAASVKKEAGVEGEAKESTPSYNPLTLSAIARSVALKNGTKRGYSETKLSIATPGLRNAEGDASIIPPLPVFIPTWAPSKPTIPTLPNEKPAPSKALAQKLEPHISSERKLDLVADEGPPAKEQVVGWPPVRSYRRQTLARPAEMFVKVNMDGITVGRKVDLHAYTSYESLLRGLEEMFQPSRNAHGTSSTRDHDSKHFLLSKGADFVLTYEDKEGDWMLVGDVPWSMFVSMVRRLRITRGADATGLGVHEKPRYHGGSDLLLDRYL